MSVLGYLDRANLAAALATLTERHDVYAPLATDDGAPPRLAPVAASNQVVLEPCKPLLPLKTLFLPTAETLFEFRRDADPIAVVSTPATDRAH